MLRVVQALEAKGYSPLLVHQPVLRHYGNYKKICQCTIMEKLSKDDLFFLLAALDTSRLSGKVNLRQILTNDILQQHYAAIRDPEMKKLFTIWQAYHQVRVKYYRKMVIEEIYYSR